MSSVVFIIHFRLARGNLEILIMAGNSGKQDKKSSKGPTPEEILNGFQTLRAEQRALSGKLSEFELDLNEHR